jgi:Zinc metalloprotease (elastase)
MGQNEVSDSARVAPSPVQNSALLNEFMLVQSINDAKAGGKAADPNAAPDSLGQRMVDVTVDGVKKIPEGFKHSLNFDSFVPNVAAGFGIGAGMKLLLPAGGPIGKAVAAGVGLYFVGKPLVESYVMAGTAETKADMDKASNHLGDTLGGMPVAIVEGGIGAKLGTMGAGALMGTRAMAPMVAWKTDFYNKLDVKFDNATAGVRTKAFEQFGIGGPVMKNMGTRAGFVPPHVLEELARTTKDPVYLETIKKTETLALNARDVRSAVGEGKGIAAVDHKGAREVYDAQGQEQVGVKVRSEGEPKTGNADVDNVYELTGEVRSYWNDLHNRNSIDGKGMKMESTVNYGDNFENAFWDGSRMTYGKPGPKSPFRTFIERVITGHETRHGVTEFDSGMVYRNQSGALNEHLSDVFGVLLQQRKLGQRATEATWLVGEGIWQPTVNGKALRSMKEPGTAYNDPLLGKDPQPGHMRDYNKTRRDNGGVHINSGIPNKAFQLFAEAEGGFAWEKPGHIWHEAGAKAGSEPSFAQFAFQTIEAARRLGHSDLIPKLEKAWNDVGIKPSATDVTSGVGPSVPIIIGMPGDSNQWTQR